MTSEELGAIRNAISKMMLFSKQISPIAGTPQFAGEHGDAGGASIMRTGNGWPQTYRPRKKAKAAGAPYGQKPKNTNSRVGSCAVQGADSYSDVTPPVRYVTGEFEGGTQSHLV